MAMVAGVRRASFLRETHLFQARIPAFEIAAVGGFLCARDRDIALVIHRQERRLAGQGKGSGPIRREPLESAIRQVERIIGVAVGAVEMNAKKGEAQRRLEEKTIALAL
jgi:hypothetical protein